VSESHRAERPDRVVLGRIVRAQGLKGAVRVLPYDLTPEVTAKLVGKAVFLRPPSPDRAELPTTLTSGRWQKRTWIVELGGCATRTEAEALVGWEICVAEEDRPPLGPSQFYGDQLIGLRIETLASGEVLGDVAAILPSVSTDLMAVRRSDGKQFLIPMLRAFIKEIDLSERVIRVDLPAGLTEING